MSQTRLLTPADLTCPKGGLNTHRFVVVAGSAVCTYCRATPKDVANATPILHTPVPCTCWSCAFAQVRRCGTCHLDMNVHGRGTHE